MTICALPDTLPQTQAVLVFTSAFIELLHFPLPAAHHNISGDTLS